MWKGAFSVGIFYSLKIYYNAGISAQNLPNTWAKLESSNCILKLAKKPKELFLQLCTKVHRARWGACDFNVYLSLTQFNQGSSKLVPCVFSVNCFLLLFRFQRTLGVPSKDMVCQKAYQNKFFLNFPFSNLWNSSPSSFIPQGAGSEEVDGTNKSAALKLQTI